MELFQWYYHTSSEVREYGYPILYVDRGGVPGIVYFETSEINSPLTVRLTSISLSDFEIYFDEEWASSATLQEKRDMVVVIFADLERVLE
jgi:hypothetical protein